MVKCSFYCHSGPQQIPNSVLNMTDHNAMCPKKYNGFNALTGYKSLECENVASVSLQGTQNIQVFHLLMILLRPTMIMNVTGYKTSHINLSRS